MKINRSNISVIEKGNPESIWNDIEEFGKYAFNKSHAVAYSLVSYATAKVWTYNKEGFLEWTLNNTDPDKKKKALDKCKEIGLKIIFPEIGSENNFDHYVIKDGYVYVPSTNINESNPINYFSSFLFSDENKVVKCKKILEGALDNLTQDRKGMIEFIKSIPDNKIIIPNFPDTNDLSEIIHNCELMGIINIISEDNESFKVKMNKPRAIKIINIYKKNRIPNDYLEFNIKNDIKNFGFVKNGQLSSYPELNEDILFGRMQRIREHFLQERDINDLSVPERKQLRNLIDKELKNLFSSPAYNRKKNEIEEFDYKVFFMSAKNFKEYKYCKIVLKFNDGDHVIYTRDNNLIDFSQSLQKNTLHVVHLAPQIYINKNCIPILSYVIKSIN